MENKKNPLYQVLFVTGIAVTIFSLWGIVLITSYPYRVPQQTPSARETASEPQPTSHERTSLSALTYRAQIVRPTR